MSKGKPININGKDYSSMKEAYLKHIDGVRHPMSMTTFIKRARYDPDLLKKSKRGVPTKEECEAARLRELKVVSETNYKSAKQIKRLLNKKILFDEAEARLWNAALDEIQNYESYNLPPPKKPKAPAPKRPKGAPRPNCVPCKYNGEKYQSMTAAYLASGLRYKITYSAFTSRVERC
ncbi:MAG: hypothetical protein FWF97_04620 [Alphaproteobacteria bacterium]|nr:hypothetical protein [Alphaproteobacteria bacterium]